MAEYGSGDLVWDQQQLAARISDADGRAVVQVHELYQELRAPLQGYLTRVTGASASEAEDIIQETFVQLLLELLGGRAIRNPRPWAFKVAYHTAIDRLSKQGREATPLEVAGDRATAGSNAEEQMLLDERGQRVTAALGLLTVQERQCIELRAEGLRYREIAEALGLQISTVSTFVFRAVRKIARHLDV
jgi:RNA polymerase sigma-70 factor (ECF subfamily)